MEGRQTRRHGPMPAKVDMEAGDAISVLWPKEDSWYDGRVESFDAVTGTCEVLYHDGERQWLDFFNQKKYKIKLPGGKSVELIDRVRASNGDVKKQLQYIGETLKEMAQRLPAEGCASSREGWWTEWYSAIKSAAKASNVIALVKVTWDLGCQLNGNVTTQWWKAESANWRGRLRSVRTCEELVSCVEDIRINAVDWKAARNAFTRRRRSGRSAMAISSRSLATVNLGLFSNFEFLRLLTVLEDQVAQTNKDLMVENKILTDTTGLVNFQLIRSIMKITSNS